MPLDVSVLNTQKIRVTADPRTASGQPATLDGPLTAVVVSGDGTVQPGNSNLEIQLLSGDQIGVTVFEVSGDADLGAGVVTIRDTVTMTVGGEQAEALGLVAGAPEPK